MVCSSANSRERWKSVNPGNQTDSSSLSNVHQQETHGHPAYANTFSANLPHQAFTCIFIPINTASKSLQDFQAMIFL